MEKFDINTLKEEINSKKSLDKNYIQLIDNEFKGNINLRKYIINNLKENIEDWNSNHFLIFRCLINKMTNNEVMSILLSNKKRVLYYFNDILFKYALMNRLDSALVDYLIENFVEIFDCFDNELVQPLDDNKVVLDHLLDSEIFKSDKCNKLRERLFKLSNQYLLISLIYLNHDMLSNFNTFSLQEFLNITKKEFSDILDNVMIKVNNNDDCYNNYFKLLLLKSRIPKEFLLYKCSNFNNKTILEIMISKDSKENIKKFIINNGLNNKYEIVLLLKMNGIDIDNEIKFDPFEIDEMNIERSKYESFLNCELSKEELDLIKRFRTIFISDGESDIEIIDLACNSFRYLFSIKFEFAKRDLQSLIIIKLENPSFKFKKGDRTSFNGGLRIEDLSYKLCQDGIIYIKNDNSINDFNHEFTHALHFYIKHSEVPEQFSKGKFEINRDNYNKLVSICKSKVNSRKQKILESGCDYYSENKVEDLVPYETFFNELINRAENDDTYSEDVIEYVRNHFVIEDIYRQYYNRYYAYLLADKSVEDYFYSIIDIVDALCEGEIFDEGIEVDGYINHIGHGKEYFKPIKKRFEEIFADYVTIIKSHHKDEALMYLESIVGRELIEILDNYYKDLTYRLDKPKRIL